MKVIEGKYNKANVYADLIDETTEKQVLDLCNAKFSEGSHIAIMPDCHAGAGCVIGTTMTIDKYICPNLVGVDIGCGVLSQRIEAYKKDTKLKINLELFDKIVHLIPDGFDTWPNGVRSYRIDYRRLKCAEALKKRERLEHSMGTLGGGNHFIELGKDSMGMYWLTIHSGSRNLGLQVAQYYQKKATELHPELGELAYLEGELKDDYLNDMKYCQEFASHNRNLIWWIIYKLYSEAVGINIRRLNEIETVHNYIGFSEARDWYGDYYGKPAILRKGAVRAFEHEVFLVPLNMAQGILLCRGKGNAAMNYSAPHGAGRVMSRKKAKAVIDMKEYQEKMKNIYSTTVSEKTLDEAPQAYKRAEDILDGLKNTADIIDKIVPVYNYKSED